MGPNKDQRRMALYRALDGEWCKLGQLGLGSGKALVAAARSLGGLVECKYEPRFGHLVWRKRPASDATRSTAAVGSASIHKPLGPAPTASDRTGIASGKAER